MREPWDWIEADLVQLIAIGEQESLVLDYKSCDALAKTDKKKDELSKDVSAFADSAGGTTARRPAASPGRTLTSPSS